MCLNYIHENRYIKMQRQNWCPLKKWVLFGYRYHFVSTMHHVLQNLDCLHYSHYVNMQTVTVGLLVVDGLLSSEQF